MKKSFFKYQLKYWLPVYIYLLVIFYFSSLSAIPEAGLISAKFLIKSQLQHLIIYAGLALTIYRAVSYTNNSNFIIVSSTTLYGILDEIHQSFIPGRFFSFGDILMDFLGAVLALILLYFLKNHMIYTKQ